MYMYFMLFYYGVARYVFGDAVCRGYLFNIEEYCILSVLVFFLLVLPLFISAEKVKFLFRSHASVSDIVCCF